MNVKLIFYGIINNLPPFQERCIAELRQVFLSHQQAFSAELTSMVHENLNMLERHIVDHAGNEQQRPSQLNSAEKRHSLSNVNAEIDMMNSVYDFEMLPPPADFSVLHGSEKITCTVCNNNGWKICDRLSSDGKMTSSWSKLKFKLKRHLQCPKHIEFASRFEKCAHKLESHSNTHFKAAYKCVSCVYEHISEYVVQFV